MKRPIILASQSPQRKTLLEQIGFHVHCHPVDIDETPLANESPSELVLRLAVEKAMRCFELQGTLEAIKNAEAHAMVGADTTIDLDGVSLGKPSSQSEALDMLQSLASREHKVHTGVSVVNRSTGTATSQLVTTIVSFGPISTERGLQYWESGEPLGKAGAYGIQGLGAQFVAHLSGSYTNVVGLPLYETLQMVEHVTFT